MIRPLIALLVLALAQDPPKPKTPDKPQEPKKETEAEALLKKIEEKATKAKSLTYKSKMTMTLKGKEVTFEGEGSLKEGNKAKVSFAGDLGGMTMEVSVVSDGSKMHVEGGGPGGATDETVDAPKDLAEGLRICVVRVGAIVAMSFTDKNHKEKGTSFKELAVVSNLRIEKDEKVGDRAAKVLTFSLEIEDDKNVGDVKLWVDAETLAPLKRELTGGRGETMVEIFSEWKLDVELKDDLFKLPKEK